MSKAKQIKMKLSNVFLIIPFFFLNSCLLTYITEPDQKYLTNDGQYDIASLNCTNTSKNRSCNGYKGNSKNFRRFKLSETKYLYLLEDEDAATRTRTATEVAELGLNSPEVINKLESLVINDPSKWVRRAAVKSLAKISGTQSRSILKNACKDKDQWVRHSAKHALLTIK